MQLKLRHLPSQVEAESKLQLPFSSIESLHAVLYWGRSGLKDACHASKGAMLWAYLLCRVEVSGGQAAYLKREASEHLSLGHMSCKCSCCHQRSDFQHLE